jgi:fatty acid hydroxylase family protein
MRFTAYRSHRADHSNFFWPMHRFHHAGDEFRIFNSVRIHPAELAMVDICTILPATLLDASPRVMADVGRSVVALRYAIHSRINHNRDGLVVIQCNRRCITGCTTSWIPPSPSAISTRCRRRIGCSARGVAIRIRARASACLHLIGTACGCHEICGGAIVTSWKVRCAVAPWAAADRPGITLRGPDVG